jgi:diketogulonate reductase-like aldo/keto reductase
MLTAYNQVPIPSFMYGTAWKKEATTQLVLKAVAAGFTAIDTANQLIHYQEALVGEALLDLAKQGTPRERLFVQTKFTPAQRPGPSHALRCAGRSHHPGEAILRQLPGPSSHRLSRLLRPARPLWAARVEGEDWEVWAAIEALYDAGKTKMIGISNVSADQLTLLCAGRT